VPVNSAGALNGSALPEADLLLGISRAKFLTAFSVRLKVGQFVKLCA